MSKQSTFGICKTLVTTFGHTRENPNPAEELNGIYTDPFGCGLWVNYSKMRVGKMKENVMVYLGGRQVFNYNPAQIDVLKVNGRWEELLADLELYELFKDDEEPMEVNRVLADLCRTEAHQNGRFLEKYYERGLRIAKTKGERKDFKHGCYLYHFETTIGGKKVLVKFHVERGIGSGKSVVIVYGDKTVFSFDRDGDPGGYNDDKGRFTRGEWEDVIDELYQKL